MKLFRDRTAPHGRTLAIALVLALTALGSASNAAAAQAPVPLATAGTYAILAGSGITNTGVTTIFGDVGSSATSTETGFTACPGAANCVTLTGTNHTAPNPNDSATQNAKLDLVLAFDNAAAQTPTGVDITFPAYDLGGKTLVAGVYNSTGSIQINGPAALTLDGNGNADSVFIFQAAAAGDLTVGPTATVSYINGAQPCNVFWKVQSAFLTNTNFNFVGTIMALTQITLTSGITVDGRLLARNADVTLIHDTINKPTTCVTQSSLNASAASAEAARQSALNAAQAAAAAREAADAKVALDAKTAADAATKAAADAKAAADVAAKAAAAADVKTAKDAAEKAAKAASVAIANAKKAKAAAAKAAAAKARGHAISTRNLARPARRHAGFTG